MTSQATSRDISNSTTEKMTILNKKVKITFKDESKRPAYGTVTESDDKFIWIKFDDDTTVGLNKDDIFRIMEVKNGT